MTTMLKKWEVWIFFLLIVLANIAFVAAVERDLLPQRALNLGRFVLLALVLSVVVFTFRGMPGIIKLLKPITIWRISPGWYLLVLLWAPAIAVIALVGKGMLSGNPLGELSATSRWIADPSVMRTVFIGSLVGEIVWVGYAIRSLSDRFSVLLASLIVGFFWWMWWTPLVFMDAGISIIPGLPPLALLVNVLGAAIMCAFIYAHTRSGLAVLVLQVVLNSSVLIFPVSPLAGGGATYWAFVTVYAVAGICLHVIFGPKPLFTRHQHLAAAYRPQKQENPAMY